VDSGPGWGPAFGGVPCPQPRRRGTRPDSDAAALRDSLARERTVLANERTLLAWIRTALAFLVTGLGSMKLFDGLLPDVLAGIAFVAAGAFLVAGGLRYSRVRRSIRGTAGR
jgi:putative membrane protein